MKAKIIYSLILARILFKSVRPETQTHADRSLDVLRIPEQSVLLLANLDGAATELQKTRIVSIIPRMGYTSVFQYNPIPRPRQQATHLRNQHLVTRSHTHGDLVAILVQSTRSNSEDLGLVDFLHAALREEDAGGGLGLRLDALDQDTVQKRNKVLDVAEGLDRARPC